LGAVFIPGIMFVRVYQSEEMESQEGFVIPNGAKRTEESARLAQR